MEQDDLSLDCFLSSASKKRLASESIDGFNRQPKKNCAQPSGWYYSYGSATASDQIPYSWTQDGALHGTVNALDQSHLDLNPPGLYERDDATEPKLSSDGFSSIPEGYLSYETSRAVTETQRSEAKTQRPEDGFSLGRSVDGSTLEPVIQAVSDLDAEVVLHDANQPDAWVLEGCSPTVIKNEYVSDIPISLDFWDDCPLNSLQLPGVCPSTPEEAKLDQKRCELMTQTPGSTVSERLSTLIQNQETNLDSECIPMQSVAEIYDTCFGVIEADALSSFEGSNGSNMALVKLRPCGDILKLYYQDSNKYAGLLTLPGLCRLLDQFLVQITATLIAAPAKSSSTTGRQTKNEISRHQCSVRIVVYGLKREQSAIGELLSVTGLYLQHPSIMECETDIEYCNPHYLLRPGGELPKLEDLSTSSDARAMKDSEKLGDVETSRLMRIFDSTTDFGGAPQEIASPRLRSTLKDHQLIALFMMVEKERGILENATFPSIWEFSPRNGTADKYQHRITSERRNSPRLVQSGILADEMGLGKTLSLLALICSSLDTLSDLKDGPHTGMSGATLVVTPKSTIPGWLQQIDRHIHQNQLRVVVYHGSNRHRLPSALKNTDLILTTYETLRSDWQAEGALYACKWYRLVLDEAHHIRNRSSQTFKAACAISSQRRWCLTGTPIQNSLDDYGALLSFLDIYPFEDKSKFDFWIAKPLRDGRADGMRRLKHLIGATCLRRTKTMLADSCRLPERIERTEKVEFPGADKHLYTFFKRKCAKIAQGLSQKSVKSPDEGRIKEGNILTLINFLRLICDHGEHLLPQPALNAWKARDDSSINLEIMQTYRKRCYVCDMDIEETDISGSDGWETSCEHWICSICASGSDSPSGKDGSCRRCTTSAISGDNTSVPTPVNGCIPPSAKIEALLRNLRDEQASETGDEQAKPVKSVVFSCWTKMLDLIQHALLASGFRFQRVDGKTSLENRSKAIYHFNEDPTCTVLLASIGCAGEGIDLTVANHVHLIEPQWNPMAEAQALDRVHRIGQEREVVVTRYIMLDSVETYIQGIQEEKLKLIQQSIDSECVSRGDIEINHWERFQSSLIG